MSTSGDSRAPRFNVYLNGVLQKNVIEVDAIAGYIITAVVGENNEVIKTRWDGKVVVVDHGSVMLNEIKRCLECPYMRAPVVRNAEVSCIAEPTIRWFPERIAHNAVDKDCVIRKQPRLLTVVS
jgi:hypothetical protein